MVLEKLTYETRMKKKTTALMKNSYQFLKLNLCLIFCWMLEMKMPISNVISLEVCTHKGHVSILDVSLD